MSDALPPVESFRGWNCHTVRSGSAELLVPREIGPRIVGCRLDGGPNLFAALPEDDGGQGEAEWRPRGGHRLWHAPEAMPRTYDPDNAAIEVTPLGGGSGLRAAGPEADPSGIHKTIDIQALDAPESFRVEHRLTNRLQWPVELAPWAVTIFPHGGLGWVPAAPAASHEGNLLPTHSLVQWAYTRLDLPLWQWHRQGLLVDTTVVPGPQKLGFAGYQPWLAYWQPGGCFVKASPGFDPSATYPDRGSTAEVFVNEAILELETLAPLGPLEAGASVSHTEVWGLFADLPRPDPAGAFFEAWSAVLDPWLAAVLD